MGKFIAAAVVFVGVLLIRAWWSNYLTGHEDLFILALAIVLPLLVLRYWKGRPMDPKRKHYWILGGIMLGAVWWTYAKGL